MNTSIRNTVFMVCALAAMAMLLAACGEEGESGSSPLDCGDHGHAHDGHCHCDDGYLFDGETCVDPSEITEICEDHEHEEEGEEDHEHAACLCPAPTEECHCEHGDIVTYGGDDFCVPDYDH